MNQHTEPHICNVWKVLMQQKQNEQNENINGKLNILIKESK